MTFAIDTGNTAPQIIPKSATVDSTMNVRFTSWERADRTKRQIIEAIEAHDDPADLDEYIASEDLMIDALHLFDPDMSEEIKEAHETLRAALIDGAANLSPNGDAGAPAPLPATAQSQPQQRTKTMFAIDTGDTGGSLGPVDFVDFQRVRDEGLSAEKVGSARQRRTREQDRRNGARV